MVCSMVEHVLLCCGNVNFCFSWTGTSPIPDVLPTSYSRLLTGFPISCSYSSARNRPTMFLALPPAVVLGSGAIAWWLRVHSRAQCSCGPIRSFAGVGERRRYAITPQITLHFDNNRAGYKSCSRVVHARESGCARLFE